MPAKKSATSDGPAALTFKDTTETQPAVPPESDREQKRNLAYLVVLAGVSAGEMFKLQEDKTVVGRGPTVAVRLNDEGVSREHCQSLREGEKIIAVDLGSTNGTFVNGIKIDRKELTDGDKIMVDSGTPPELPSAAPTTAGRPAASGGRTDAMTGSIAYRHPVRYVPQQPPRFGDLDSVEPRKRSRDQ